MFILIWEPLQKFIIKGDGAGRSIVLLTIILIATLINRKSFYKVAFSKPLVIWCIWIIYAFTVALVKGYSYDLPKYAFFMLLLVPYVLMITINLSSIQNFSRIISILIIGLYLNLIITLLFNSGQGLDGRYGGDVSSTTVGIMSTVLLMFLYLKYVHSNISIPTLLLLAIIPFVSLLMAASKTAFGGFILLILSHFIINRTKNTFINLIKISFGVLLLLIPLTIIINNTTLGERISSSTEEGEELEVETGNAFLDKFGDRGIFYYIGWQVFKANPVTGVGLGNYIFYNDDEMVQHSEYMIQLSELGSIGFLLFISFYFSIFTKISHLKKKLKIHKRSEVEICYAYIIIILVMISSTRMFMVPYLFSVVGVVTGYILKENTLQAYFNKFKKA